MITLIIYLTGLVASFLLGRHALRKDTKDYNWFLAVFNLVVCLFSWLGFLAMVAIFLSTLNYKKVNVPKWL